jgi:hypothetical protein
VTVLETRLMRRLKDLSPERLAEVFDFVEFLASREQRSLAAARMGEALARIDAIDAPPMTDEEIDAEITQVEIQQPNA